MLPETALNGRADLLATFNRRDFEGATVGRFGVAVAAPGEAVRRSGV